MKKRLYIVLAALYIIFMTAIGYNASLALFVDSATSTNNTFSAASEFATPSATITSTPTPTPTGEPTGPQPGDVVINELMWPGSFNANDEWIELRNMTGSPINLTGWMIDGAGSGSNQIATISAGTIPANGFFLISHFDQNSPSSILNTSSDFLYPSISLNNDGEQLVLKRSDGSVIDTANTPPDWFAGTSTPPRKSMERNAIPGVGTTSTNWHTATTQLNLDPTATESATPKAIND